MVFTINNAINFKKALTERQRHTWANNFVKLTFCIFWSTYTHPEKYKRTTFPSFLPLFFSFFFITIRNFQHLVHNYFHTEVFEIKISIIYDALNTIRLQTNTVTSCMLGLLDLTDSVYWWSLFWLLLFELARCFDLGGLGLLLLCLMVCFFFFHRDASGIEINSIADINNLVNNYNWTSIPKHKQTWYFNSNGSISFSVSFDHCLWF